MAYAPTLFNDMQAMLDTVTREHRDFTATEQDRFGALEAAHAALVERERVVIPEEYRNLDGPHSVERRVLGKNEKVATRASNLSLSKTIRGLASGNWENAAEERAALGLGSGGSSWVPVTLANEIIDAARAQTVAISAGAHTIPMKSTSVIIPRVVSDPVAAFRLESAIITESPPVLDGVTLTARSLAVLMQISRELLMDSPTAEQAIRNAVAKAIAVKLDQVVLNGSGAAGEPRGILNTSGISSVSMGVNGASLVNYDPIIQAKTLVLQANRPANAFVLSPREAGTLAMLKTTQNQYLTAPTTVTDMSMFPTTSMPIVQTRGTATTAGSIIVGAWSSVFIGMLEECTIQVLHERFADYGNVGLVIHLRADVAVGDVKSFAAVKGII